MKPDLYLGISESRCPTACTPERCIITNVNVCGHPHKGGLQEKFVGKSEYITRRLLAAKAIQRDSSG